MAPQSTDERQRNVETSVTVDLHGAEVEDVESDVMSTNSTQVNSRPEGSSREEQNDSSIEVNTLNTELSGRTRNNQTAENDIEFHVSNILNGKLTFANESASARCGRGCCAAFDSQTECSFEGGSNEDSDTDDDFESSDEDSNNTEHELSSSVAVCCCCAGIHLDTEGSFEGASDEESDTDDDFESRYEDSYSTEHELSSNDEDSYDGDEEIEESEENSENNEEISEYDEINENDCSDEEMSHTSSIISETPFILTPEFLRSIISIGEERVQVVMSLQESALQTENLFRMEETPQPRPDIKIVFPGNYFALHNTEMDKETQLRVFEDLVSIASDVVQNANAFPYNRRGVHVVLAAQEAVLKCLTKQLVKHKYCKNFTSLRNKLEESIRYLLDNFFFDTLRSSRRPYRQNEKITGLLENLEILRIWDAKESFYGLKSSKFEGVTIFDDFLPKTEDPDLCGICMATVLEPSSDFGILSECSHVFCSACLARWLKENASCPVCRRSCLWMSKRFFMEQQLRNSDEQKNPPEIP